MDKIAEKLNSNINSIDFRGITKSRVKDYFLKIAFALVLLISTLVLLGWITNASLLKAWSVNGLAMNPITAIFFILIAIELGFQHIHYYYKPRVILLLGSILLMVGIVRVLQFAGLIEFSFDDLLFSDQLLVHKMTVITAACFVLLGLWYLNNELKINSLNYILPLLVCFVSFTAIQGMAFGNSFIYSLPMAANTAICFFFTSISFLCLRKNLFYDLLGSKLVGGKVSRIFFLLLILIVPFLGFMIEEISKLYHLSMEESIASLVAAMLLLGFFITILIANNLNQKDAKRIIAENKNITQARMLQSIAVPIISLDNNAKITHWNLAAEKLYNISSDEAKGHLFSDLLTTKYINCTREDALKSLIDSAEWTGNIEVTTKDNRTLYVISTCSVLKDENGFIYELIAIHIDITNIKDYEHKISELNSVLNSNNEKLKLQLYDLEAFAGNASHDLRSPLNNIISLTEILTLELGDNLSNEALQYIDLIKDRALFMNQLIQDLLKFSMLGAKKLELVKVNLNLLIKIVCQDLITDAVNARKKVIFNIEDLKSIQGDVSMLRQVFTNLISNALKFTLDEQEINIAIRGQEVKNFYVVTIMDNGIGIDKKYHNELFLPFKRFNISGYEGTGLGLTIVKRILEKHQALVRVESEQGIGTNFIISFPV